MDENILPYLQVSPLGEYDFLRPEVEIYADVYIDLIKNLASVTLQCSQRGFVMPSQRELQAH